MDDQKRRTERLADQLAERTNRTSRGTRAVASWPGGGDINKDKAEPQSAQK